jgi:sugar/nucleoside kinase (ribokinase family)
VFHFKTIPGPRLRSPRLARQITQAKIKCATLIGSRLNVGWNKSGKVYYSGWEPIADVVAFADAVEVDPTGSGELFPAAFFIHLQEGGNPLSAARFANLIASKSVSKSGLESVPDPSEIAVIRDNISL